jgi:hypothetical protein
LDELTTQIDIDQNPSEAHNRLAVHSFLSPLASNCRHVSA